MGEFRAAARADLAIADFNEAKLRCGQVNYKAIKSFVTHDQVGSAAQQACGDMVLLAATHKIQKFLTRCRLGKEARGTT